MFLRGDYIMYSNYGVCIIDEIIDKITDNENKKFYLLHPMNDNKSRILTPIDNSKVKMRTIMTPEDAEEIYNAILNSKVILITNKKLREQAFNKILKDGNPSELVELINTLILEENEKIAEGKKFSATDKKYLDRAEKLLFPELSVSLKKTIEQIREKATIGLIEKI